MKKSCFTFITFVVVLLLFACNITNSDDGGNGNTNPESNEPIDSLVNSDGKYNGNWRIISEEFYEKIVLAVDNHPEFSESDSEGQKIEYTDTAEIVAVNGDTIAGFSYEESYGDKYKIEYMTFSELAMEHDTGNFVEEMQESIGYELGSESVTVTSSSAVVDNRLILSGTTLKVRLFYSYSVQFYVVKDGVTLTGTISMEAKEEVTLLKYSGEVPPSDWPDDFVIDTSDDDNGNGSGTVSLLGAWKLTLLPSMDATIPDTTEILINVNEIYAETATGVDTVYVVLVSQKTLMGMISIYSSKGDITLSNNTVTLMGTECLQLNSTTLQMDTLPSEICDNSIALSTEGLSETTWGLPGTSIAEFPFLTEEQKTAISMAYVLFSKSY